MGTDLASTSPALPTRYSPPVLSASLRVILTTPAYWNGDKPLPPLVGLDRDEAQAALLAYASAPKGSRPEHVAKLVATLSWMPRRRAEGTEGMMLAVYERQLVEIDEDVLTAAFDEATKRCTFFPSIAEILDLAAKLPAPKRVARASMLRRWLAVEPEPEIGELVAPEDVAALRDSIIVREPERKPFDFTPYQRQPRPTPTVEQYMSELGLTEEDAQAAWNEDQARRRRAAGDSAPPMSKAA